MLLCLRLKAINIILNYQGHNHSVFVRYMGEMVTLNLLYCSGLLSRKPQHSGTTCLAHLEEGEGARWLCG